MARETAAARRESKTPPDKSNRTQSKKTKKAPLTLKNVHTHPRNQNRVRAHCEEQPTKAPMKPKNVRTHPRNKTTARAHSEEQQTSAQITPKNVHTHPTITGPIRIIISLAIPSKTVHLTAPLALLPLQEHQHTGNSIILNCQPLTSVAGSRPSTPVTFDDPLARSSWTSYSACPSAAWASASSRASRCASANSSRFRRLSRSFCSFS